MERSADLAGETPVLCVDQLLADGSVKRNADIKAFPPTKEATSLTTTELPAAVVALQVRLAGRFRGEVVVSRLCVSSRKGR